MHEMSIALGIVQTVEKTVKKRYNDEKKDISYIEIDIGTLSGIEIESLNFVWFMAVKDTLLEKAKKKINLIEAKAKCSDCGKEFDLKNIYDACPFCGSYFKHIYKGKELRIKFIEIE